MAAIAGPEVGRPTTIGEVTADWLTTVLRTSGALDGNGRVSSVEIEPFAVGIGFLSELNKVTMRYEGEAEHAPATVIVKMVTPMEVQRGLADALLFYQRELRFYRELAGDVPLRTARIHAAMMAEDSTEFVLVMEDLSSLRSLDQATGVGVDDALVAVEAMAAFHACFAGRDLSGLTDTFLPFDNPVYRMALPGIFEAGWPVVKEVATDVLTPEIVAFGDRFSQLVPFFMESLSGTESMVHGDWRADNLLVDDDGGLAVLDFQLTGTGRITYDLGYFLSQSMEPDVRRSANQRIVDHYFAALDERGVVYDRADLEQVFRIATAWCLIYPVANFPAYAELPEPLQKMVKAMLARSVASIIDQGSLDLLP